jgi:protein-S-isoprenylcysteine O-methyltransferase Ste14
VGTNIFKTATQSLVMWIVFLLLAPTVVYRLETRLGLGRFRLKSPLCRPLAVVLFLCGWATAWSSAGFIIVRGQGTPLPLDAPRKLVITGPYRYVRNPMAMGSILQGIAIGVYRRSPLIIAYALFGSVSWNYMARPWEELDLERRFGESYAHYRAHVRCWIPGLKPYEPANEAPPPSGSD